MWKKKFPGVASMISPESTAASSQPSVAPVGEAQPDMAAQSMNRDLMPQAVPQSLPAVPKLNAQPDMNMEVKKRALKNIAMGRKGF